eukprot:m51a1_g8619 hypothetical protein (765) ;mRNA; r:69220-71597
MHRHVSGALKQHNKKFKARYATKGAVRKAQKGRVGSGSAPAAAQQPLGSANARAGLAAGVADRDERRNRRRVAAATAREALIAGARMPASAAPRWVAFVALGATADAQRVAGLVCENLGAGGNRTWPVRVRTALAPRVDLVLGCGVALEWCRAADHVVMVASAADVAGVGEEAELKLSLLKAQGVPSVSFAVHGMCDIAHPKRRREAMAGVKGEFEKHFPEVPKVFAVDTAAEAGALVRSLAGQLAPRVPAWREALAYALVDSVDKGEAEGEVRLTGWVKGGATMSARHLVHVADVGAFQVSAIARADGDKGVVDSSAPEERESLQAENVPEEIEEEQTWPTAEELAEAEARRKKKKLVPKGTSSYQAAWIADSDDEADGPMSDGEAAEGGSDKGEDESGDEQDEGEHSGEEGGMSVDEDEDEDDGNKTAARGSDGDDEPYQDLGDEDGLEKKWRESRDDAEFPDEVDTPTTIAARLRFQKYRGLRSFRTSPWDPQENLPFDYGRIFQLANYRRVAKRVLAERGPVLPGMHVVITLVDVPAEALQKLLSWDYARSPLVASALRKHENMTSVVHWSIRRHPSYTEPLKSRESLVFRFGFRSVPAQPTFSETCPGVSKQKFLRYLQPGDIACATVYGPITFGPCPLLVFKETPEGGSVLVATGSLIGVDPDRVVCKKIVLTGFPFKITKKRAVVRAMFWNPEDIEWFKPVELWTKYGRRGNILESLGTHGHMRCTFDGALRQNDTVCMSLYKRVYPKWALPPQKTQ